eukprot:5927933-Prymnesium_polylepis.1
MTGLRVVTHSSGACLCVKTRSAVGRPSPARCRNERAATLLFESRRAKWEDVVTAPYALKSSTVALVTVAENFHMRSSFCAALLLSGGIPRVGHPDRKVEARSPPRPPRLKSSLLGPSCVATTIVAHVRYTGVRDQLVPSLGSYQQTLSQVSGFVPWVAGSLKTVRQRAHGRVRRLFAVEAQHHPVGASGGRLWRDASERAPSHHADGDGGGHESGGRPVVGSAD